MKSLKFSFEKYIPWLLVFLNIVPILIGFAFINLCVVDVPYHDQFHQNIPNIIKYHDGSLTVSDFLTVNNDHRPVFVHILSFLIDAATGVNNIVDANVGYLLHVCAFIILWFYCKRSLPTLHPLSLYMLPVSWYFFNLYLISAYLWGILLSSSLCLVALFSMVFFIEKSRDLDISFLYAIIAAIAGMFSWVAGLFLFPAGFLQIICSQSMRKWEKIMAWTSVWAGMLYLNYIILGFSRTGIHGYEGYSRYILSFIQFPFHKGILIIQSLGSTIIHSYLDSVALGFLLLAILVCILIHERESIMRPQNAGWLALLLYSFLVHFALVVTRSGEGHYFGPANSLFFLPAVRHFPSTFVFIIGLYGLVLTTYAWNITRQDKDNESSISRQLHISRTCGYCVFLAIVASILFFGCFLHCQDGMFYGVLWAERNCEYREVFIGYSQVDDTTLNDLRVDRHTLEKLEKYNLSMFKPSRGGLYPDWLPSPIRRQILNSPRIKIVDWE